MKALVLAAAIVASPIEETRPRRGARRDDGDRRAERKRFTEQDLEEMLGSMEPTPEPPPPLVIPEPDFIRWEPGGRRPEMPVQRSIAA